MHGEHAHYPHAPAKGKRETSAQAAAAIADKVSPMQKAILNHLADDKLTTFELAHRMNKRYGSVQPRTSELSKLGKIKDSGMKRKDPETGKNCIVWELVQ